MAASPDLQEVLKPFYQRASEAEERLARLEVAIAQKKDSGSEELAIKAGELQSELDNVKAERDSERLKCLQAQQDLQQLAAENAKLQYRISHLIRALKEIPGSSSSEWPAHLTV